MRYRSPSCLYFLVELDLIDLISNGIIIKLPRLGWGDLPTEKELQAIDLPTQDS